MTESTQPTFRSISTLGRLSTIFASCGVVLGLTMCFQGSSEPVETSVVPAANKTVATETMATKTMAASKTVAKKAPAKRTAAPFKTERGFLIHDSKSAPVESLEAIAYYQKNFQFVPNLGGVMAESPALVQSYYQVQSNLQTIGSLTPPENNIVQMSIAMENECQYCVAGHSMAGKMFFKSSDAELEAIRTKAKLPEVKANALRAFALAIYESKGRVTDKQLQSFLSAGYSRKQALDVVTNVAAKVMSNFSNQLARTPIDKQFKAFSNGLPFAEDRKTLANNTAAN